MANHVAPFFCAFSPSTDLRGTRDGSEHTERVLTKNLHQAEKESIFNKMKAAQDRGKPVGAQGSPPAEK
jgi:hypothetical protein